ncbi:hypothetical protein [Nocardioides montaniterrae]
MKITTEPRSDQLNYEDFIGSPRTFLVTGVKTGTAEQKYDIQLAGESRFWRPPLTVLRLLVAGWGDDATIWPGRGVTLYGDPSITFGRDKVGGIRVSHMSHLPDEKPLTVNLTATRGKRVPITVQPMPRAEYLRAEWRTATTERKAEIEAEVARITGGDQ